MKTKMTFPVVMLLSLALNAFGQGQVLFRNTPSSAVIDGCTLLPVASGVAAAGLYYTTDLASIPNLDVPNDGWLLSGSTPVTPVQAFPGVYSGGTVTIEGLPEGTRILMQVRAWCAGYASYEAAWFSAGECLRIGASNVMPASLGGGILPVPNISTMVQGFVLTPCPEPSAMVLGILGGLGALFFIGRRSPGRMPLRHGCF